MSILGNTPTLELKIYIIAERNGTRVRLVHTQGAARLHAKTVEEMSADKAAAVANAAAADKGKMTRE